MPRFCPKCPAKSSNNAEFCEGCGFRIVPVAKAERAPRPRKPRVPRVKAPGSLENWARIHELCPVHGADCDKATCSVSDELAEAGIL